MTDDPSKGTDDPSKSTDNPSKSTDDPSKSTDDPSKSTDDPSKSTDDPSEMTGSYRRRAVVWLFGDRLGLVIFLGSVAGFFLWWRIGFFITDSTTVANALVNVGNGRLEMIETPYSLTVGSQPGLVRVDDQLFGRNYGHVLLALPVLWLLEGASAVTDPALLLAGVWSLLVVAVATQVAALTGTQEIGTTGSVLALVLFVGNVVTSTSLSDGDQPWAAVTTAQSGVPLELLALQITTMLAGAVLATTTYRLLELFHGQRVGLAAGIAVVFATPVGFWASIPKRHVITATAVVVVLYCFAVSRTEGNRRAVLARGGAYATLGLLTTIHPFEALFLFVVLGALDVLTAPSNDVRSLALVGVIFFLALVPFFVVNTLISGNPIRPPRMLPGVAADIDIQPALEPDTPGDSSGADGATDTGGAGETDGASGANDASDGTGDGDTESTSPDGDGERGNVDGGDSGQDETGDGGGIGAFLPLDAVLGPLARGVGYGDRVVGFAMGAAVDGFRALGNIDRLYPTFLRSGRIPGVSYAVNDFETVELALLEAFPLAAVLALLPVTVVRRIRHGIDRSALGKPVRQTDLLAAGLAVVFVAVYMPRLPLHSMVTLRYILPVMPLLLYGVARLSAVRRTVETVPQWLAGAYGATVVGGGLAIAAVFAIIDPAVGEAVQFHALVGLASAAVALVCLFTRQIHGSDRAVAVGLALPAGITTLFLTMSSLAYFDYGRYALGLVRVLADLLPFLQ